MKFLLDVHISTRIARAIGEAGHDVVRAALTYPTWADQALLELAVAEHRIIVTQDSDFTDLIFAGGHALPPALIYIRCEPDDQPTMAGRILDILQDDRLPGHIVVITPPHARFRAFPKMDQHNDRI